MNSQKSSDADLSPHGLPIIGYTLLLGSVLLCGAAAAQDDIRHAHFTDSITERTPLVTTFPKYPYVARRDRIEGETVVCFTISSRGEVVRPTVRSATHRIFRRPAIKAIRESTYEPLAPGETLSMVKSCRTFRFRLDPVLADNSAN
jgi:TonB family protein